MQSARIPKWRAISRLIPNHPVPSLLRPDSRPFPRRTFFSLPSSQPQTLTASRTLPYSHEPLYDLIADVESYSEFVPYCSHSRVIQWSAPDPSSGRRWPTLADLHVGWGSFNEVFTSRLTCIPGVSVEALSGGEVPEDAKFSTHGSVFKSLDTLWTLKPLAQTPMPCTEVHLTIKFQFINPIYAAVSAAVSDTMAGVMIEAFEKQVHQRLKIR